MRASDREREAVIDRLRRHTADGRLTVEELEERMERAYGARTRADLARLTEDLPGDDRREAPGRRRRSNRGFRPHLRAYLLVGLLLIAIWAATGAGYFWPLWPLLGWGIGVTKHARLAGGGGAGDGGDGKRTERAQD